MRRVPDPIDLGSRASTRIGAVVPPGALFIGMTCFFLVAMRQTLTVPATYGLTLAQTLFLGGALLWLGAVLTGHATLVRDWAVIVAVLGYMCASFASYTAAAARGSLPQSQEAVDRYVLTDVFLAGAVLLILTVVRTEHALRVVLAGIVLGATVSSLFALLDAATGIDVAAQFRIPGIMKPSDYVIVQNLARAGVERPQGSAGHPLELGAVLTVAAPLAFALYQSARARTRDPRLWAVCGVIIVLADIATVSRSGVVGGAVAVAVMCWRWPVRRLAVLLGTAVVVVIVGVLGRITLITALIDTFAGSSTDSSLYSRQIGRAYVLEHLDAHLWLGQGVGAYPTLGQPVLDNQYLSRLMESGLIGLVSFCVALAIALYLSVRASAAKDRSTAELASGISGAVAAVVVICLILDTAGFRQIWYLIWILLALAGVAHRLAHERDRTGTIAGDSRPAKSVR